MDTGFDGDDPILFQRPVIVARIVHVEAQEMRTAMRVIQRNLVGIFDDAQFYQTSSEYFRCFFVQRLERGAFVAWRIQPFAPAPTIEG